MEQLKSLEGKDVFVLGAGFSKAIDDAFPLADDLLDRTIGAVFKRGEDLPLPKERFEEWLSRIAEDQPYLSVDQNLSRSSTFLKVSSRIAEVLRDIQHEVFSQRTSIPMELSQLLEAWHLRQSTVISFNYDNLVESGLNASIRILEGHEFVTSHDILDRLPPLPPSQMHLETASSLETFKNLDPSKLPKKLEPISHSFHLLKLHGSLSWYWVPGDTTGATVQRWADTGSFGNPSTADTSVISRAMPGRVPFIVPPSSTKSQYLSNPVIRELWTRAFEALKNATRVIFVGYSVPIQDHAAISMIQEALAQRHDSASPIEIIVVDTCPAKVVENLNQVLPTLPCRSQFTNVAEFVEFYLQQLQRDVADNLQLFSRQLEPINLEQEETEQPICGQLSLHTEVDMVINPYLDVERANVDSDGCLRISVIRGDGKVRNTQMTELMAILQRNSITSMKLNFDRSTSKTVFGYEILRSHGIQGFKRWISLQLRAM